MFQITHKLTSGSTYVVSAHGALLVMDTPLIPGQSVRLSHDLTSEAADCHVTSLHEKWDGASLASCSRPQH